MYCTVKDHNSHDHDAMKKVTGRYCNSLNEFTAQLEDMITGLSKAHKRIDEKMKNEGDEVNRVIDLYYDDVVTKTDGAEKAS